MQSNVETKDETAATLEAIDRFNEAFSRGDVDGIMAAMTVDCVFESTYPPPDGHRYEGQAAVREAWEDLFRASPDAHFEAEDTFAAGARCTVRWIYRYSGQDDTPHHLRGVDVFRVRDGKVAEKYSYVKG